MMKWILLHIVWFLLFSFTSLADIRVESIVDQNEIGLGDTLTLTVSISSSENVNPSEPRIPNIDGFHLLNSWTSSSASSKLMKGPNGMQFETVHRQEFNYSLTPQRLGSIQIPAIEVNVEGKVYYTKSLRIQVSKNDSAGNRSQGRQQQIPGMPDLDEIDKADEAFQQLLQRRGLPSAPPANKLNAPNPKELVFIRVELDKTSAYEGEQITANWYLYTRSNILSLDRLKFPDLKGFWKEIIEEIPTLQFEPEILNGVEYRKALLASHALFPIKAGTSVIDEYKVKASVQSVGTFGFGPAYTFTRSSDRVKIDVKPLPPGKPDNFTGAVGQFEVQSSIEGKSFPVNQPFTLKIRFDGSGNAKTIDLPALSLPAGLEQYDTKNESKFFKNGKSFKEFEVLIIPRKEGEFQIPAMSFSLFDPSTHRYYTKSTQNLKIAVSPNSNSSALASSGLNLTNENKSPVMTNKLPDILLSWEKKSDVSTYWKKYLNWFLWIGSIFILIFKIKKELLGRRIDLNLSAEISKRVKKIQKQIEQNQFRAVGVEGTNLIYFVLGQIAGLGGATHELEKMLDLAPPSLRRNLGEKLTYHSQVFQTLGFAPEEVIGSYKSQENMREELKSLENTLNESLKLSNK